MSWSSSGPRPAVASVLEIGIACFNRQVYTCSPVVIIGVVPIVQGDLELIAVDLTEARLGSHVHSERNID